MKSAALILPCLLVACNMTQEDHQRVAQSLQTTGANMSQQYNSQPVYYGSPYVAPAPSPQEDLDAFRRQSDQRRAQRQLDQIERNTDPYRVF